MTDPTKAGAVTEHNSNALQAPVKTLREVIDFVEANHPLPRCLHGHALRDHSGEILAPSCGCKRSSGAIRAGRNISEKFRKALPNLPASNADTLAAIIDKETAAPELLAALQDAQEELRLLRMKDTNAVYDPGLRARISAAIRRSTEGQ